MRTARVIVGAALWLGLLFAARWWLEHWSTAAAADSGSITVAEETPVARQLWRYVSSGRSRVALEVSRPLPLAVGDPIFVVHDDGAAVQVGEVSRVADAAGSAARGWSQATSGEALLYPHAPPLRPGARLDYYTTPDSLEWVVETMLPPHKRRRIAEELSNAFHEHEAEILQALRPVVEASLRDALAVVEQDLPKVIEQHRPELEKLGQKYRGELIERRLTALVQREIWPIVQRRAEPLAEEIGLEVWQRASIWRFGWRYAYDVSPLPQKNMMESEWRRFLEEEAIPVLEAHTDHFVRLQQQIVSDVARNERVRRAVRQSLIDVAEDPAVQRLGWGIFRDALLKNERLRETLERHWRSEEARRAMSIAAERLEPTVRRIGDLLFGTEETGISPEFARVLRSQILQKDRRWLVLRTPPPGAAPSVAAPPALRVRPAPPSMANPFLSASR